MESIKIYDRVSKRIEIEKVYGAHALKFLYGGNRFGTWFNHILSKNAFFSHFYGLLMKSSFSKRLIFPFIEDYSIDILEFEDTICSFASFNDFFIRKLKKEARPIHSSEAIIPADGRYYFFSHLDDMAEFLVKGKKFNVESLLRDETLAKNYLDGSIIFARLCPVDYHRFHFPCDGIVGPSKLINGYYYSVNPLSVRKNMEIFSENKRMVTEIESPIFGKVLFIEIGATNVGSIHQTYTPNSFCQKGSEKGYFSFGGSALIILFQKNKIAIDQDLLDATKKEIEIRCLMGQSMGQPY